MRPEGRLVWRRLRQAVLRDWACGIQLGSPSSFLPSDVTEEEAHLRLLQVRTVSFSDLVLSEGLRNCSEKL